VNVNAQANSGSTPLMMACNKGRLMATTILIAAGANLALLDNLGRSALRLAERRSAERLVARNAAPPAADAALPDGRAAQGTPRPRRAAQAPRRHVKHAGREKKGPLN